MGVAAFFSLLLPSRGEDLKDGFVLREMLNRRWSSEMVTFPISASQEKKVSAGAALVDSKGNESLYQVFLDPSNKERQWIAFLADLAPSEIKTFGFSGKPAHATTDLRVEETGDAIRLINGKTGIAIRKHLSAGEGPIQGVRLSSGHWTGGSSVEGLSASVAYSAEVVQAGKVFAEVAVRAQLGNDGEWTLRFRLQAGEPVILVDEIFSRAEGVKWALSLSGEHFSPDTLYYRSFAHTDHNGRSNGLRIITTPVAAGEEGGRLLDWDPWARWWDARSVKWFGVWNPAGADLLMLGARDSDRWLDPEKKLAERTPFPRLLADGGRTFVSFPMKNGERRWMIGAFPAAACAPAVQEESLEKAPLPQQYVIKSEFPLDRVKDLVLQWNCTDKHPHLFVNEERLKQLRKQFQPDPAVLEKLKKEPVSVYTIEEVIPYFLASNDPDLGALLARFAVESMGNAVDVYLNQGYIYSFGYAPHMSPMILAAVNSADAVIDSGFLEKREVERIRAQAAFIGYTLIRPDYWSTERRFSANPNMTTMVACYQAAVGSLIPSHPQAANWVSAGVGELKRQLDTWSDSNGGWMEAPHYAMVSYDYMLGAFVMARNSGFVDHVFDPKIKRVLEWLAKIATPHDSRFRNLRHLPPIGNTWRFEPSGEYGLVADLWKEHDPKFAAQMQWMHRQQGSWPSPGVGGQFPAFLGYRKLFLDPSIPEEIPSYGSELFPETGVVLRNQYPSKRESMLHMIAGSHYQHYDFDSGSVTLWGKGRIIADEFGYYGRAPVADQSMVESAGLDGLNMRIKVFSPSPSLDYVSGTQGGWIRQIAFVKDDDPLGANYFLIRDTLREPVFSTWRLWLSSNTVNIEGGKALFVGEDDVDADIRFLLPAEVKLETEVASRKTTGAGPDSSLGQWQAQTVTMTCLKVAGEGIGAYHVLIYPRLKSEAKPVITSIADGRGVKVESPSGTDYVFLSNEVFNFREGTIAFEGTIGAIQLRKNRRKILSLGDKGSISMDGNVLTSEKAAMKVW